MLMKDRLMHIRNFIKKNGKVSLKELENAFPSVSSMTLRRDLLRLEESNDVIRVSGGAVSVDSVMEAKEADMVKRIKDNATEKIEIAEKAVKILEPNSCVFIDGGSTTTYFARALPDDEYYVITNAITIAETVLTKKKTKVALLGGDLRRNNFITVGSSCLEFLDVLNIQTAVLTATGYLKETGEFTCGMQAEADVKRKVIEKADKVIMLLDNSKVNKKTPYTFANLYDVDCMVVDERFPTELKNFVERKGVKII